MSQLFCFNNGARTARTRRSRRWRMREHRFSGMREGSSTSGTTEQRMPSRNPSTPRSKGSEGCSEESKTSSSSASGILRFPRLCIFKVFPLGWHAPYLHSFFMRSHLVIVERPAKAKTIKRFLGKDYIVEASMGHVRDLPSSTLAVDVEGDFTPEYEVPEGIAAVVKMLKSRLKEVDDLWIATDEDREGEAIGWHLTQVLKVKDPEKVKRIVFHEITESAIHHAIETPRTLNMKLVDAQQARRVLDRLVGYTLSPFLWKKVYRGLSAGRVQSVAVKIIVDRE